MKRLIAFFIVGFFIISIGNAFAETHSSSTSKRIQVDEDVFVVSHSGITYVKIFGNLESYSGGNNIFLTVTNPDGSTEEIKTRSSSDGYYETLLGYDRNDIMGIYNVFCSGYWLESRRYLEI